MASSVDGLVSGLNTSDLINQLMQAESVPKTRLQQKVTDHQAVQSALQQINSKLKALFTAADSANKADTYALTKASSSSDAVVASAAASASTGSLTFDVTALAKAHVLTAPVATNGPTAAAGGIDISINGANPVHVAIAANKNTPQGVADAINAAGLNIRAAVVDTGTGSLLQFTSTKTGTSNAFTVTGLVDGNGAPLDAQIATQAANATIRVGGNNPGAYTVTSDSNTFTGLMNGVTLTATREQTGITVSVTRDVDGIANKVQAMVDAANAALADISLKSNPTVATSPLKGNPLVREAASEVLSSIGGGQQSTVNGVTTYTSYSTIGVQLDRSGKLTFDRNAFVAAYTKDPAGTQKLVQDGVSASLKGIADGATNSTTGTITTILSTGDTYERRLNDQINGWDKRLEVRKTALQKQFSDLEVSLSKLKNQSSWLAGQIAKIG